MEVLVVRPERAGSAGVSLRLSIMYAVMLLLHCHNPRTVSPYPPFPRSSEPKIANDP